VVIEKQKNFVKMCLLMVNVVDLYSDRILEQTFFYNLEYISSLAGLPILNREVFILPERTSYFEKNLKFLYLFFSFFVVYFALLYPDPMVPVDSGPH
jgi:hypothetical protein